MGEDAATARRLQLLTGERTAPGITQETYWFARHEAAYAWVTGALGPVHRALDAGFSQGLYTYTGVASSGGTGTVSFSATGLSSRTTYYYRIRANNAFGGSSAWTNALPFPIRTGN